MNVVLALLLVAYLAVIARLLTLPFAGRRRAPAPCPRGGRGRVGGGSRKTRRRRRARLRASRVLRD